MNRLGNESAPEEPTDAGPVQESDAGALIDQMCMYKHVFLPIDEHEVLSHSSVKLCRLTNLQQELEYSYWVGVVLEYIRSLSFYQMNAEYYLYKLVIGVLVRAGRWYQLHQLLQYHIIGSL